MERGERRALYQEVIRRGGFRYNADFISAETYDKVFNELGVSHITMLDLGAGMAPVHPEYGSSPYTKALEDRGVRLVPVDTNLFNAKTWHIFPRGPLHADDTYAEPVVASATKLPILSESVNGILSVNLFNAFKEPPREIVLTMLKEAFRALKPGGFFLISTFGYYRMVTADGTVRYNDQMELAHFVTPAMVTELAAEAGFTAVVPVPLDGSRVQEACDYWKKFWTDHDIDVQSIDVVDAIGLVLKK